MGGLETIHTLEVKKEVEIAATIGIVWETMLEHLGPLNESPTGEIHKLKLEPWPGGRWYRDFGNNTGHCWGYVQAIEPPSLIEIHGPMFMSAPAISHVIFRLKEEGGLTHLKFSHRAIGQIPENVRDGMEMNTGWSRFASNLKADVLSRLSRNTKTKKEKK
ncbi:MAG TPA: SRPBCC domain-containing protein [Pseudacidobacterium sp.]|jgi:uncharacterized protein YndB with AHSA1/START domain|nr:SRPBCC domain-containing protein [Pseudacidobacterium sp.]